MPDFDLNHSYVVDLAKELLAITANIVVKREDLAEKYETIDTAREYDYYNSVTSGSDKFESYDTFTPALLTEAGLTEEEIQDAALSKMNIPMEKRDAIVALQRIYILENYEEKNNYYRMLSGLPANEEYTNIYIEEEIAGVDISKPIHEMTDAEIFILMNLGYIDATIDKYPTRQFLKFLGASRIDNKIARLANRFDILRLSGGNNTAIKQRFRVNYETSRTYILNNYYRKRFSIDQTYFDAYIGFIILVNAIVMTINDSVEIFNKHEFSNEITVRMVLQSHNLDMFNEIPYIYKKRIADNIKSLIVSKGTDEVLFKIFKIFGFDDVTVRKFILVKEHLKDIDGNYVFSYEEDGTTPVYDEMYDIHFAQVDIRSENIDNEIRRPENKLTYADVADNDIYWGGYNTSDEIKEKLLKEDFNYIDTDYININTAYSMSELNFELTYFLSSILALKSSLENLVLVEPLFGQNVSLFYTITMISALLSKKIGYDGAIVTDPADIATIYKFNFDRDIAVITEILTRNNYTNTDNLATVLPSTQITEPSILIDLYFNNKEVYDRLIEIRSSTRKLNEYLACQEIIKYITQSKLTSNVYKKPDDNVATTYLDYLESGNQVISTYIDELETSEIDNAIFRILTSLEDFMNSDRLKFMFVNIPTFSNENSLKLYMQKVIDTFKAFTISLFSMSITYDIDDLSNNIKILDTRSFEGNLFSHNNIPLIDSVGIEGNVSAESSFRFNDELELISYYEEEE